ncbi:hypothetical protein N9L68_00890 [bacterium]|nr:hypothetical protein [bacterium]
METLASTCFFIRTAGFPNMDTVEPKKEDEENRIAVMDAALPEREFISQ